MYISFSSPIHTHCNQSSLERVGWSLLSKCLGRALALSTLLFCKGHNILLGFITPLLLSNWGIIYSNLLHSQICTFMPLLSYSTNFSRHYIKYCVLLQILAELERILEKTTIKELQEIWKETVPKIFKIASGESNAYVKALLDDIQPESSECKFIKLIVHSYVIYTFSDISI